MLLGSFLFYERSLIGGLFVGGGGGDGGGLWSMVADVSA